MRPWYAGRMDKQPIYSEPAEVELSVGDFEVSVDGESVTLDLPCDPALPVIRLTAVRGEGSHWAVEVFNLANGVFEDAVKVMRSPVDGSRNRNPCGLERKPPRRH